jgi:uncharacterized protein (TIGR02231 family)
MVAPRILLIAGLCLLITNSLSAQTREKLNIEHATVFLNGAELESTARLTLAKGENEILFTNVAGNVNSQSLIINATNGVVVEAATFQNDYLATEVFSPRATEIKDSIALVTEVRAQIQNKITMLAEQIAVLQGNRKVGGENTGLSVAELTKMLDLISSKMENILNQKTKQEELLKKTDERLAKLKKQLDEEQKKEYMPGGQLLVKFYTKEATSTSVIVNYIVPNAGWTPTYDIFAEDIKSPLKLYYKANIYQNSGVKWNNVRLTLSTGNPQEGVQAPVMSPWYLSFYTPPIYNRGAANNMYQAAPQMMKSKRPSAAYEVASDIKLEEQASMNEYVSVDNSGVNTTFDIDLPYTVPSDGKQHLVAVKKYDVPATYRYFAVPKLDKDAFLQAEVTNWEDLNLLPGQTNIFYEGAYVGQGYIDMRTVKDTMYVSLGRDKKIVIKREREKSLRSVKTIGTQIRETCAFTISVRNTRRDNINITIQDQMPVSNDKDIVIEDKETDDSDYDETSGAMKWVISVAPNETKKLSLGYTVKYPKGKTIPNLCR